MTRRQRSWLWAVNATIAASIVVFAIVTVAQAMTARARCNDLCRAQRFNEGRLHPTGRCLCSRTVLIREEP